MGTPIAALEALLLFAVATNMILSWAHPVLLSWYDIALLLGKASALSLCCVVSFYYNDLYDFRIVRSFGDFIARLLQSFGVAFILLAGFYSVFPKTNIGSGPFVSSILIVLGLLLPLRILSYAIMRSRPFVERLLVLGTSPLARLVVEEIQAQPNCGYQVVGVADDSDGRSGIPVTAPLEDLPKLIDDLRPDRLVVALADRRGRLPVAQLLDARMRHIIVEEGVEIYERLTGKLAIESLTPSVLIFSKNFLRSRFELMVGRALSLVVAAVGAVFTAPLVLLIAVAIKLDSPGPVFFVQERVGAYGRRFNLIKFRTMHPTVESTSEWARDNTDRITRLGAWLRKFRLDELPQFVNILRGDMNLIGPRPHPVSNYQLFVENIPYYLLRSGVRPGVTGWAQIRYGYANDLGEETEKMRYDLYYIKHLSVWLDFRILFDTIKIVMFGRGAQVADAYQQAAPAEALDVAHVNGTAHGAANGVVAGPAGPVALPAAVRVEGGGPR